MLVYSDNVPQEFEFLQGGILVRWEIEQNKSIIGGAYNGSDKQIDLTEYNYQEIKIELTDTLDQIVSKLTDAGYADNVTDFANKIIAFRG